MANFTKTLLRHSATWSETETTNKEIVGFPEHIVFHWEQGFDVLHFINRYMDYKGWQAEQTFQKIETAIKTRLPFSARTHKDVQQWLDTTFKK